MKIFAVLLLSLVMLPWAVAQDRDQPAKDQDQTTQRKDKDKTKHKSHKKADRDEATKPCSDRDDCPPAAATQDRDQSRDQDRDRDRNNGMARESGRSMAGIHIANGPRVEGVHATHAQIAWSTNVPSSAILRYGTNPNDLDQTAEAPWGGGGERNGDLVHRVELRNLRPNTTYYFRVDSTEARGSGTAAQSGVQSFHTPGR